jgi:hypothetical protein
LGNPKLLTGKPMKNLLEIKPIPLTCSIKKLIFVFILLLILPLTGCKSVVKETDVKKPVRIVSPNGDVYVGEVMSGKPHGQGTITYPNGRKYVGEWKDGLPNGQGTDIFPDGRMYVGESKDGNFHGQGTLTSPSGYKYEGEWKDGRPNGRGTEIFPDGSKGIGEFRDGRPWNNTVYDKNGNILGKYVNGEPIEP